MYYSTIMATFSAAHSLRNYQGKCERLHGHNWRVEVTVAAAELDRAGMGLDFTILREKTAAALAELDHRFLNECDPFRDINPSSELIARHLYERVGGAINDERVRVVAVRVWESDASWAEYRP